MVQKTILWTRVDTKIRNVVEKLAKAKGVSISEYLRDLVLEDLDRRTIFTTVLKEDLEHRAKFEEGVDQYGEN
ncbi:MAG: hypothetical protein QXT26_02400 [Thermoproteota archaeon]